MRKKYLYSSYSAPRTIRGVDVVSDLFADYYFSFEKSIGVFDAFIGSHTKLLSAFLLAFIFSLAGVTLQLFLYSLVSSIFSLALLCLLVVKWFSFKHIFNDLKENQIF